MTTSTIEVFVRPVKYTFGLAQHLYLLSTDSKGNKKILRAGPETNKEIGMLIDDLNYGDLITHQCNSMSEFRDTLSPLYEKLFEICTFVGINSDNLKDEL